MLSIAHRGYEDKHPENTVRAVKSAASCADMVEIDVRRCESGELVVFHDTELSRVTGNAGLVSETPWERLRELDVLNSGERIPRFTELLSAWPSGTPMNLDISDPEVVPDALAHVTDFEERVLISVGDPRAIEMSSTTSADLTWGYTFTTDLKENVDRARSLGYEFVHTHYRLCLETDLVEYAHDAGLRVDAWTVSSPTVVEKLRERGVDAVTATRGGIF